MQRVRHIPPARFALVRVTSARHAIEMWPTLVLLVVYAGVYLQFAVQLAGFPFDLDQGEGYDAWSAWLINLGQLPYTSNADFPYYSSNYPPLWSYLVSIPMAWSGPGARVRTTRLDHLGHRRGRCPRHRRPAAVGPRAGGRARGGLLSGVAVRLSHHPAGARQQPGPVGRRGRPDPPRATNPSAGPARQPGPAGGIVHQANCPGRGAGRRAVGAHPTAAPWFAVGGPDRWTGPGRARHADGADARCVLAQRGRLAMPIRSISGSCSPT